MKKILIVEDDILIAEIERDYLEAERFEVTICQNGQEGLRLALENNYDLIILDVMLPGTSGFAICREIRREKDVAVIMVTAKKDDVDKIRGLGLGADDYIVKPFSPGELVARVKAHINIHEHLKSQNGCNEAKSNDFETGSIRVANLKIFPLSRQVFCSDREVEMANKEFELLYFLASNPNIVFSKDALFDKIWGRDAIGGTATVAVHINRIREKIGTDKENLKLIETVWGAGYRFRVK